MTINREMDKDVVHITQSLKKKEVMPFMATWIDLNKECHTERRKSDRGDIPYDIPYM